MIKIAVTSIWKVETRLDNVIKYITNENKTMSEDSFKELHNLKDYSSLSAVSEENCYISGINCTTFNTYKEMLSTKKEFDKTGGILAFHAIQSFKENEVTPDKAHLIGIKLAQEMWGDRFEVIVATHINTNHIHNHFVINSVSFQDGKKYSDNRSSYAELRHISDSLCEEYGLSVLEEKPCEKSKINYENYYKGSVAKNNYHTMAKEDIDKAIKMANSYSEFIYILNKMNYKVNNRYGKLTINHEPYKKNIRIERAFGENYSINNIVKQINENKYKRKLSKKEYTLYEKIKVYEKSKNQKSKGLYGLYKYYCYLLKVYPRHYPRRIMSPTLKLEVKRMEQISQETMLLVNNKIKTYEQLLFYKNDLLLKIENLEDNRQKLWRQFRNATNEEEKTLIKKQIEETTQAIRSNKKEVVLCEDIAFRSGAVEKNIKDFEKENGKEQEKNE